DLELLIDDRLDARAVRALDDGALLRAEHALIATAREQRIEARHRLHQLHTVLLGLEPLVDLQERDDALLLPQILRTALSFDVAIHRVLEEDRADDAAVESRARHDTRPHFMNAIEHLRIVAIRILADAVRP